MNKFYNFIQDLYIYACAVSHCGTYTGLSYLSSFCLFKKTKYVTKIETFLAICVCISSEFVTDRLKWFICFEDISVDWIWLLLP